MVNIYYRPASGIDSILIFETIRNKLTWAENEPLITKKIAELDQESKGLKLVAVNQLEINEKHDECFTVLWGLRGRGK